jgi:hypothetical protein
LVNNEGLLENTPLTPLRLLNCRRRVADASTKHDAQKALPFMWAKDFENLAFKDACMLVLWFLSGLRADSWLAIKGEEVRYGAHEISLWIRKDKIKLCEQRMQKFCCSCGGSPKSRLQGWHSVKNRRSIFKCCPVHQLDIVTFPIEPEAVKRCLKLLELTQHSFRRGLALATRAAVVAGKDWYYPALGEHIGWKMAVCGSWSSYSEDFKQSHHTLDKFPDLTPLLLALKDAKPLNARPEHQASAFKFKIRKLSDQQAAKELKERWRLVKQASIDQLHLQIASGLRLGGEPDKPMDPGEVVHRSNTILQAAGLVAGDLDEEEGFKIIRGMEVEDESEQIPIDIISDNESSDEDGLIGL